LVHDDEIEFNNPKSPNEILASNFWWNRIIYPWDVGFLKSKAAEFHGLGCPMCGRLLYENLHSKNKWAKILGYPQKRNWDMKESLPS
jgi:hypothetical protein